MESSGLQNTAFIHGSRGATWPDSVPPLTSDMPGENVGPGDGIRGCGDGRQLSERGEANIEIWCGLPVLCSGTPRAEAGSVLGRAGRCR